MNTKVTAESSTADVVARYQDLSQQLTGGSPDPKSLAKRGKAKLLEKIAEWEAVLESRARVEARAAEHAKAMAEAKKAEEKPKKEPKAKKEPKVKGPVIRHEAEKLLMHVEYRDEEGRPYGLSYEGILNRIKEQFEGAKTTVACLRWYAVHMRERGQRVPHRPRAGTLPPERDAL